MFATLQLLKQRDNSNLAWQFKTIKLKSFITKLKLFPPPDRPASN